MSSPPIPVAPRSGFIRRTHNHNRTPQSADDRPTRDSVANSGAESSEDHRSTASEHAFLEHARQSNVEVRNILQECPCFVLDLVDRSSFCGFDTTGLDEIPFEFPDEVKAIVITCMLSRKRDAERYLLDLRAARLPMIVLCVEEGIRFRTDEILDANHRFLELGATDLVLQSSSITTLRLDLLLRIQSAARANHLRRVEERKYLEERRKMIWPYVHRIMEGFPALNQARDSQTAPRTIQGRLHAGGMGTVFKCMNATSGRQEVVKAVPKSSLKDIVQISAIWKEIMLLQKLQHPNIVAFRGAEQTTKYILIFMDFAGSLNLRAYLKTSTGTRDIEEGPTITQRMSIASQISAGLAHSHENGVAHRDLKPENIVTMVFGDGHMVVQIVDFGLATESTKPCTDFVGTFPFIAPEVATSSENEEYGPACADMWSFGVLFLEILCGIGKINRMLQWSRRPSSKLQYRRGLERFFCTKERVTASVEADIGLAGSESFPGNAHASLLGMLTVGPLYRWNATTILEILTQEIVCD